MDGSAGSCLIDGPGEDEAVYRGPREGERGEDRGNARRQQVSLRCSSSLDGFRLQARMVAGGDHDDERG